MTIEKWYTKSRSSEKLEEAVGMVWQLRERGERRRETVSEHLHQAVGAGTLELLAKHKLAEPDGAEVQLTPEGERRGREITRRHRLAERLLRDVLDVRPEEADAGACQMEHILSAEVSDAICTLLGHPRACPHGEAIPDGACCARKEEQVEPLVLPLSQCRAGDAGRIAYLQTSGQPQLHKLLALGVIPGMPVRVHQTFPSFVIEVEQTQLALEKDVAQNILLRRN